MKVYQLIKLLQRLEDEEAVVKLVATEVDDESKIHESFIVELGEKMVEKEGILYLFPEL